MVQASGFRFRSYAASARQSAPALLSRPLQFEKRASTDARRFAERMNLNYQVASLAVGLSSTLGGLSLTGDCQRQ